MLGLSTTVACAHRFVNSRLRCRSWNILDVLSGLEFMKIIMRFFQYKGVPHVSRMLADIIREVSMSLFYSLILPLLPLLVIY